MALFTISDLHLSSDSSKSMEVFGDKWSDYMNRIKQNWENSITSNDTIIIPGDISWATYLGDSVEDFKYLNELPGRKIISKGNHDYWWTTARKLEQFIIDNEFENIYFMHNNSYVYKNTLICGTRGWNCPENENYSEKDLTIFNRELIRLKLSLQSSSSKEYNKIITAIHYPPFNKSGIINKEIENILKEYNVNMCIYGHLHGSSQKNAIEGIINGIEYKMVSADYINFMPIKLED